MKALTLLLLLACPFESWAFLGLGASNKINVLWMPEESFSDWDRFNAIYERYPDLKLTVGLAPEVITPEAARRLLPWIDSGRLEIALRLKGDPILPLIASHALAPRPQDAPNRIAAARERYQALFGAAPIGLAAGGGAAGPVLLPSFKAMGISWVAVGPYAPSTAAWISISGLVMVPFETVAAAAGELTPESISLPSYPQPAAFVIDEADGFVLPGSFLRLLETLAERRPEQEWTTVSAAIAERPARLQDSIAVWPTWGSGGLSLWSSQPASKQAWRLYGEAARTLDRYQNSGAAELKTLENATEALYEAQSSRYYRLLGLSAGEGNPPIDREFRGKLAAVYRKLKQTPPETLYIPLSAAVSASSTTASDDGERSTDIHFSEGPSWIAFDNPAASFSRAPDGMGPLEDGTPAQNLWKILSLRVDWDDQMVTLVYRMSKLGAPSNAPFDLGELMLDTYIDLNRVAGAGSTSLLPGRSAFMQARDAWEYALTMSAWGAFLYKSNPLGTPLPAGKPSLSVDAQKNEIRVVIQRNLLRGNPSRWGYAAAAMAVDHSTAAKPPPLPLRGPSGTSPILGLLAPVEQQQAAMSSAVDARPRLGALRADRFAR